MTAGSMRSVRQSAAVRSYGMVLVMYLYGISVPHTYLRMKPGICRVLPKSIGFTGDRLACRDEV